MKNKSLRFPEDYKFQFWNTEVDARVQLSAIYYPNMCHVCNSIEMNSIRLKKCGRCFMISYCGKEHQNQHWIYHKDLCKQIKNLLKAFNATNLFDFLQTTNDPAVRLEMKENLIKLVERKLHRNLNFAEKLMFLQPRICVVCSESNPRVLSNCQSCPQASFCEKHKNDSGHASVCYYYRLCFLLDNYKMIANKLDVAPSIEKVHFVLNEDEKIPENMEKLLDCHMEEVPPILISINKIELWKMLCSELYTIPLTLMYILEKLKFEYNSELIVHIIGAYDAIEATFGSLEVLLHFIPQLTTLKVMMIGKELSMKMKASVNICSTCKEKNKTFEIEVIKIPYVYYVDSKSFVSPNITIAYNIEGKKFHMWTESMLKMTKVEAPFVATTRTKLTTEIEKKKMTQLLGSLASPSFTEKNPFAGIKPTRSFGEDGLSFSNNYITVYTLYDTILQGFKDQEERRVARLQSISLAKKQKEAQKPSTSAGKSKSPTEGSSGKSKKKKKRRQTAGKSDENIKKETIKSDNEGKKVKPDTKKNDEPEAVAGPSHEKSLETSTLDPSNPKNKPEEEEEALSPQAMQRMEMLAQKIEKIQNENIILIQLIEKLSKEYAETKRNGKRKVEGILAEMRFLKSCFTDLEGRVMPLTLPD